MSTGVTTIEGRNYMLNAAFKQGARPAGFYVALLSGGEYTESEALKATTLASASTEVVGYSESVRQPLVFASPAGGAIAAEDVAFTATEDVTITGFAVVTNSQKGADYGTVVMLRKLAAPKLVESGESFKVAVSLPLATA